MCRASTISYFRQFATLCTNCMADSLITNTLGISPASMSAFQTSTTRHRKGHTKSRTGCHWCKSRKIKCDEHHPSCRNCIRRGLKCDFLQWAEPETFMPSSPNMNLELLHQFTISTATTLSSDGQVRDLWRVVVPQLSFKTDYILDGILALTALHVARYSPERSKALLPYAIQHHTSSLAKALPLVSCITPQNCSRVFIFGVLTLLFSLAKPRRPDDLIVVGNGVIPEWLYLLRGMNAVVQADGAILSSPVSLIFQTTAASFDFWASHTPDECGVLADLHAKIRDETRHSSSKQGILLEAVEALQRSFTFLLGSAFSDHDKMRGFYTWLFEVSDDYLELLKEADNEALCVLAYFSVLVKDLEKHWWIEGWAVHLVGRIYMLLDVEYRLWIRWPIEEIGWVPEPANG